MNIKNVPNIVNAYKSNSLHNRAKVSDKCQNRAANTDKIDFSNSRIDIVENVKTPMVKSVASDASPERIEALRRLINADKYFIPSQSIAREIVGMNIEA
ncbi:MAG: hypothetical protein GX967_04020 [Clostridiales bacterium]|nr:hypothetical protein [Clostridiales bacterium]